MNEFIPLTSLQSDSSTTDGNQWQYDVSSQEMTPLLAAVYNNRVEVTLYSVILTPLCHFYHQINH